MSYYPTGRSGPASAKKPDAVDYKYVGKYIKSRKPPIRVFVLRCFMLPWRARQMDRRQV